MAKAVLITSLIVAVLSVKAQEWPRFRGPNGTGRAAGEASFKGISEQNLVWKVKLPGKGHSSPIGWGGKIFLTAADDGKREFSILAVEAESGRILWRKAFPHRPFRGNHRFNSFASPTAAADEERVYVSWGTPEHLYLAALSHAGDLHWKRDLGAFESQHGLGISPILFGDLAIIAKEQLKESFIIAVDRVTGETRWKTPRRSAKTAYSTPCLSQDANGNPILLVNSQAHGIGALNPETGAPLWEYANAFDKRSCSSPVVAGGLVFGSCGSGGGGNFVVAVRPPNGTTRTAPELAYEIRRSAPYVPSFLSHGGWLFLWSDNGILSCVEPESGSVRWAERILGRFFGSPVSVGDQLIAVADVGKVFVVSGTGQFAILGNFDLQETCHTTPAIIKDRMYIRSLRHLWKFKPSGKKHPAPGFNGEGRGRNG